MGHGSNHCLEHDIPEPCTYCLETDIREVAKHLKHQTKMTKQKSDKVDRLTKKLEKAEQGCERLKAKCDELRERADTKAWFAAVRRAEAAESNVEKLLLAMSMQSGGHIKVETLRKLYLDIDSTEEKKC